MVQYWRLKLRQADDSLARGDYTQAVFIGGQVLEELFRWLCKEVMPRLTPQEHEKVTKALGGFGKPVDKLSLGELVGFFYQTKLLDLVNERLKKEISLQVKLDTLVDIRNRAVHPTEKPVSKTEAELFLKTLEYLLEKIEGEEKITPLGSPRPWYQVIIPHKNIQEGCFEENVFAADLGDVVNKRGALEYQDPVIFFQRTYPTQGLINLMVAVLSRLAGLGRGEAVIQLETPFGGGKTHALIALYHLFTSPEASSTDTVAEVLKRAGVEQVPKARVVVFEGTSADPVQGKTPWGLLAEALGNYSLLEPHDRARRAPGKELLHRLIGDEPTLILIDELTAYVVKAKDFMDQVLIFLQELTEVVKASPRCALVATLPSSVPYGEVGDRVLFQLRQIFGRMQTIYTPVGEELYDEIYEIVRRRLFDTFSTQWEKEALRVAQLYWQLYQNLGDDVPSEAREPAYRERLKRAYPFHPELINILYERWSTFPAFQRTRGVLSFLARVVADLYRKKHQAPLIQPAHLNLADPFIRQKLLEVIGREYDGVIASDITDSNARAQKIDQSMPKEYAHFQIATGLATAIFFYSFSGGERKGATAKELRLSVLQEGIPPALFGDALKRLEEELWYLHKEINLYYFSSTPNINRIILDKEEMVQEEQILAEIRKYLNKMAGSDMGVFIWPQTSQDVPDTRSLKLAILGKDYAYPTFSRKFPEELFTYCGDTYRAYRNTLLVLAPDINEWSRLQHEIRKLLALRAVEEDREIKQRIPQENLRTIQNWRQDLEKEIPFYLLQVYRHLAKPGPREIEWFDLGIPMRGAEKSLSWRVKEFLRSQDLLTGKIAPTRLLEKALREEEKEKRVQDVVDAFLRYPDLPMLEHEDVAYNAIRQGVREGVFGIRIGEQVYFKESIPDTVSLIDAVLVREVQEVPPSVAPAMPAPEVMPERVTAPRRSAAEPTFVPSRVQGLSSYYLRARITWEKLYDFLRGVVIPLQNEADLEKIEISVRAWGREEGISRRTLEQVIRETLRQIQAEILEEETGD